MIEKIPIKDSVAAISVGKVEGGASLLDLNYEEDFKAEVDMNVVMTGDGKFVEIQGTGEEAVFTKKEMDKLTRMAQKGIKELTKIQRGHEEKDKTPRDRLDIIIATRNKGKVREIRQVLKD